GFGVSDMRADDAAANEIIWGEGSALALHAELRVSRENLNATLRKAEITILRKRGLKKGGSLVVAVDNLDRCSPDKMVSVLESLHNFTGLQRTRFILVGDENAFVDGIISRYPTLDREAARAYLEKIVSPIQRMPNLVDDVEGLTKILNALGLEECSQECSKLAGRGLNISCNTLANFCRIALEGNPRKALHMFRSLPSFIGQWENRSKEDPIQRSGGTGIVLKWVLTEYTPNFLQAFLAVPHIFKGSQIPYVEMNSTKATIEEQVHGVFKTLRSAFSNNHVAGVSLDLNRLAIAALFVYRAEFGQDQRATVNWDKALLGVRSL
ncbi:P-loop NTPase fold protein, partial [Planctomycetota bacterium]|nr:P-loop NTPase fold protein [Planctomycetota bacterium]